MLSSTICDKCGDFMDDYSINREDCSDCARHYCFRCGYHYETGFRYNSLIKRFIRYIRFNP
ncbi:MAG: hypothetical protein ACFE9S_09645 [Candidatus Hermodarchaeota archaeon]